MHCYQETGINSYNNFSPDNVITIELSLVASLLQFQLPQPWHGSETSGINRTKVKKVLYLNDNFSDKYWMFFQM